MVDARSTPRSAPLTAPLAPTILADLEAAPTPYHAAARARDLLVAGGFVEVPYQATLPSDPGRYVVVTGGSLVAWIADGPPTGGFTVVGAHTDSPNLRVRANADESSAGWAQVGVEVYGGVLLNSWLDRDLGLAGRATVLVDGQPAEHLLLDDRPLLRIPQLAIHLDREIRADGLKLDPQEHLTPLWAVAAVDDPPPDRFRSYLAEQLEVDDPSSIMSWDVMAFDTQPPAVVGLDADLLASARIDNLLSSFCGVHALLAVADDDRSTCPVLVLYDHEEIGSESATGAAGGFLAGVLERISSSQGVDRTGHLEVLASSFVVSADGAHATHPNYVAKHEPRHLIAVNAGVVVKRNANQRYATDAVSEGRFRAACRAADVPVQTYIHRNDLPCGSTIGPITAGRLAVPTVDVGAPQLAMHSAREMCGTADVDHLARALAANWLAGSGA